MNTYEQTVRRTDIHSYYYRCTLLPNVMLPVCIAPSHSLGTIQMYNPVGPVASFLRFRRTCWVKPVLVKSALGLPLKRGTMEPSGNCHSPTLPPSLPLQHWVLTSEVTQTKGEEDPEPTSEMSTVDPDGYVFPFSSKYRPPVISGRSNKTM